MDLVRRSRRLFALASCALALAACGGGGGGANPADGAAVSSGVSTTAGSNPQAGADYFPLAVGDRWIVSDSTGASAIVDVSSASTVPQGTSFVLTGLASNVRSESRYVKTATGVLALPDASADALTQAIGAVEVLRLPVQEGAHWVLAERTLSGLADVDSDGRLDSIDVRLEATVIGFENVATPQGSYSHVAHVRTVLTETATLSSTGRQVTATGTTDDWYAPNVGPLYSVVQISGPTGSITSWTAVTGWRVGGQRSESTPPAVVSTTPVANSVSVGWDLSLTAQFSESMEFHAPDAGDFQVVDGSGQAVRGTMAWLSDKSLRFVPYELLRSGTYTARVTTGANDLLGTPLAADYVWQFTVDSLGPSVTPIQPLPDAVEVPLDTNIVFEVDGDATQESLDTYQIYLSEGNSTTVPIDIARSGYTFTIKPQVPLKLKTFYTVTVVGFRDALGNVGGRTWSFNSDPGRFGAPVSLLRPDSNVMAAAVGDVDGDGLGDILMAGQGSQPLSMPFSLFVFRQRPDGTFGTPDEYPVGLSYFSQITSLAVVDLDGTGVNAVVAGSDDGIAIFRQQPGGTLARTEFITTNSARYVRVADMNGDGRPDFVGAGTGPIRIWYQNPDHSYAAPVDIPVSYYGSGTLAVGDVSGDGRPDIVIASNFNAAVVLRQLPDGTFASPQYLDVPGGAVSAAIGDINGDGRADVVVTIQYSNRLGVFLQDAQGSLGPISTVEAADSVDKLVLADIDGDGRLDVVSSGWGGWPLAVNRQRSDGTLGAPEKFPQAAYGNNSASILAVGDANGDGLPDVVYAETWMRQRPVPRSEPAAQPVSAGGMKVAMSGVLRISRTAVEH